MTNAGVVTGGGACGGVAVVSWAEAEAAARPSQTQPSRSREQRETVVVVGTMKAHMISRLSRLYAFLRFDGVA